ncbi:MAG: metallophosphoesterase [Anaerolineaceae bacterium]|nr:metallophosphoesterase [Anaerolineaceae bacterium]
MRFPKSTNLFSIGIALIFFIVIILLRPIWADISHFLGTQIPVMVIAALFGLLCFIFNLFLYRKIRVDSKISHGSLSILIFTNLIMISLLIILIIELKSESIMIVRNAAKYLPPAIWFTAAGLLFLKAPRIERFKNLKFRIIILACFIITAGLWISTPMFFSIKSGPELFVQQDGYTIAWETNMPAIGHLDYGSDTNLGETLLDQSHGLRDLEEGIQSVFLSNDESVQDLYMQATSEGIRKLFSTSAVKTRQVSSGLTHIKFPIDSENISFVAFSDIHERTNLYNKLSEHIPWVEMDYAVYIGDLLNNIDDANQSANTILNLPTGSQQIPRMLVRGNHETRGPKARDLSEWLLPPNGNWYFTFETNGLFFIILDSGEDKPDSHTEYAGLVDFSTYHQEQAAWLEKVFISPEYLNSKAQIILVHIPPFRQEELPEFSPVVDLLKKQENIDLIMSGHIHRSGIWLQEDTGFPYPITTCGGSSSDNMAAITVEVRAEELMLQIINIQGEVIEESKVQIRP